MPELLHYINFFSEWINLKRCLKALFSISSQNKRTATAAKSQCCDNWENNLNVNSFRRTVYHQDYKSLTYLKINIWRSPQKQGFSTTGSWRPFYRDLDNFYVLNIIFVIGKIKSLDTSHKNYILASKFILTGTSTIKGWEPLL